jgi:hypothetical protein
MDNMDYRPRPAMGDGLERNAIALWVCLTRQEYARIEELAEQEGERPREFLRHLVQGAVEKRIGSRD